MVESKLDYSLIVLQFGETPKHNVPYFTNPSCTWNKTANRACGFLSACVLRFVMILFSSVVSIIPDCCSEVKLFFPLLLILNLTSLSTKLYTLVNLFGSIIPNPLYCQIIK